MHSFFVVNKSVTTAFIISNNDADVYSVSQEIDDVLLKVAQKVDPKKKIGAGKDSNKQPKGSQSQIKPSNNNIVW